MAGDTATLSLNGRVSLVEFAAAMVGFQQLMAALAEDVGAGSQIEWDVSDLAPGSAHATVQARPNSKVEPAVVDRVTDAFTRVGEAMRDSRPVPYSIAVRAAADRLLGLLDGSVRSLTFETAAEDVEVTSSPGRAEQSLAENRRRPAAVDRTPYGAVKGRVQTLSSRNQLRFTLYDLLNDAPVTCYLREGSEDKMRSAWGRLAIVEGLVKRDPYTGRPKTIRQVENVVVMPEARGTWRDAYGVAPPLVAGVSPEDAIRKVRDG